ncbi:hypothetical protein NDU88_012565 [Pleurodeles waltl]|uniref:Uncharacterized protein n=1 Tax=Pleurodeles waltl TaxID=8319 RepID=A0AAV7R358_PLEWA|nr:hypothetical protein NDU88_012565 [Pleurodeles waltl]
MKLLHVQEDPCCLWYVMNLCVMKTPARPGRPGLSVLWGEAVRYENSCTTRRTRAVCGERANLWVMKVLHVQEDPGCLWYGMNLCVMKTPARPGRPGLSVVWGEAVRYENSCTTRRTRAVCGERANLWVMKVLHVQEDPGCLWYGMNLCVMKTPERPGGPGLSVVRGRTCAL